MASENSDFSGIQGSYVGVGRTHERSTVSGTILCERHTCNGISAAVKFCSDHEMALCAECAAMFHRACKEVDTLEELAQKAVKGKKFKQYLSDLDNVVHKLSKLKRAKNEDLGKLRTETNDALHALSEFRKEINWFLDKLERKGKSFIEKRYKEIHADLNGDAELCEDTLSDLEKLKKRLENLEDKTQRFINMKLGNSKLVKAQKICKEMKEARPKSDIVKMTVDPVVERFVMKLRWYGKHRTYLSMETPPSLPHMYTVKHDAHYDVRCKEDKSVCNIVGACQLRDGTILLADSANRTLKRLDVTYKVCDFCQLPGTPVAVCATTSGCAAVLLNNETGTNVHVIRASTSKLSHSLSESFQMPETCRGLDFCDGTYYASSKTAILTYSASGDIADTIYEDHSADLGQLRVNDDGTKLFVIDSTRGLITMDTSGANGTVFSDPALEGASGMCCDKNSQVFVCGHGSHNVILVGHEGGRLGELLDHRKDIKRPLNLCYDGLNKRLVVTKQTANYIKVFQLK